MAYTISMPHLWHHREQSVLPTKNLANMERGPHMASMGGMLELHPNIIDVIRSTFQKHKAHEFCDTVEFFQTHCKMPNVSAHDAAIYAANDLITALTKPQPTNSIISIGDDEIVALQNWQPFFKPPSPNN